ncbi:MAG: hypothetical protein JST54_18380 [Deltaproteobacteria bacterium]|nr:hypothetical protein [Deltaproteobacteria bacterium]
MGRVLGVLLLLAPALARAEGAPIAPPATDLLGPRGFALAGALRASGTSNDTIFLNPAGLFAAERYTLAAQGLYDFQGDQSSFGASIADSTAGPVAAGLAYDRLWLGPSDARTTANMFNLALAFQLSPMVSLGASGKLIHSHDPDGSIHNGVTPDVGILLHADPIEIGVAAYNLVSINSPLAPRQYGAGVGVTLPYNLRPEADVVLDDTTQTTLKFKIEAGLEWAINGMFTARAGYVEDRVLNQRAVTGGLAVSIAGFNIEGGYRHELAGSDPARLAILGISIPL